MGTNDIVINKVVTGKYEESSKVENSDSNENQDSAEKYTETVSNTNMDTVLKESDKVQTLSKKSQETVGKSIKAELTAYTNDPRCTGQWESQTAMQTKTRVGVIAAPSKIPLGSKIYIPELKNYKADGMFDVEDRGGAIKIKKDGTFVIDVWVPTYEEAVKFGRKKTTIYIVE